ncbi:MAG TPA: DUF6491 family protein [Steroidobacteraceae bacterium]|jgi:hypothetical protein|nr:DUF6491 family protein [Steroidobacteraceae bacterium]
MKISLVTGAVTSLVAAAMCAGCATAPKLDYTDYAGEPVKSFYMSNFDGWSAVSKDQLVVWSGMNKAYLLTVTGYCPDLQFANAIAVTSTANTVDRFEKVIVGRDRCLINEIRPLDTKQLKADRKLLREQMKKPAPPPPEESKTS